MLTNQVLDYRHSQDLPRLENADKTPKLNRRINFVISSDLGIAVPRFNPRS